VRVTTALFTLPRSILAELNTYRKFNRNAASSRAIPVSKIIKDLQENPFIPIFRKNGKGMQGYDELDENQKNIAIEWWLEHRDQAIDLAKAMSSSEGLNIHKQYVNRILEPWMFTKVLVTATDWANMFAQRTDEYAEPSFQTLAKDFYEKYSKSKPVSLLHGQWHTPFAQDHLDEIKNLEYVDVVDAISKKTGKPKEEIYELYTVERFNESCIKDIAAGRIAKLSYNNLETGKIDLVNDIRLAFELSTNKPGHWSPFEHICREAKPHEMSYRIDQLGVGVDGRIKPISGQIGYCGNLRGAFQYRKEFADENITKFRDIVED
jgi:hypothetical protein